MKFWLTVIISTIVVSAGSTWLLMHQGGQSLAVPTFDSSSKERPKIVFDGGVELRQGVIEIDAGETAVGAKHTREIAFHNEAKGALKFQLTSTPSCGCVQEVSIDGERLEPRSAGVKAKGDRGKILVSWIPKEAEQPKFRFSVELLINDPRPEFNNPIKVEIVSRLKPKEGNP